MAIIYGNNRQLFFILDSGKSIILHGAAGTGKTYIVNKWIETRGKEFECIRIAPTNQAAENINGQTIHSFFGIPASKLPTSKEWVRELQRRKKLTDDIVEQVRASIISTAKTIIIDEISLVSSHLLELMMISLRTYHNNISSVQFVFIGDMRQLPPVVTEELSRLLDTEMILSPYMFCCPSMRLDIAGSPVLDGVCKQESDKHKWDNRYLSIPEDELMQRVLHVHLTKNYRQRNDPAWADILNRCAIGRATQGDIQTINKRVISYEKALKVDGLFISDIKKDAQKFNIQKLSQLNGKTWFYNPLLRWNNNIGVHDPLKRTEIMRSLCTPHNEPKVLELKEGCKVFTTVKDEERGYINGKRGTFTGRFREELFLDKWLGEIERLAAEVILDDERVVWVIVTDRAYVLRIDKEAFFENEEDYSKYNLSEDVLDRIEAGELANCTYEKNTYNITLATYTILPLVLGYATTVHKVQGKTLDTIIVNLSYAGRRRNCQKEAMAYTALSRVTTLEGLYLTYPIRMGDIVSDPLVHTYINRGRQ